jgi:hypothetical protein
MVSRWLEHSFIVKHAVYTVKIMNVSLAMAASIHVALYVQFSSVYLNPNYTCDFFDMYMS